MKIFRSIFNNNSVLQVVGDTSFIGSVNITNVITACNIGVSNLSINGEINTQNNNINTGSGIINTYLINSSNINWIVGFKSYTKVFSNYLDL